MLESQFRKYLESVPEITSEKAISSRISKARKIEIILDNTLDELTLNEQIMCQSLKSLSNTLNQLKINDPHKNYANVLRHYYQFKNTSEFPKQNNVTNIYISKYTIKNDPLLNQLESEFEFEINSIAGYNNYEKTVKSRIYNNKINEQLKLFYNNTCQLCELNPSIDYSVSIVEIHHIEYFAKSQNHEINNLMVLCPNCHSLIHKCNPRFDYSTFSFIFPNGKRQELKLYFHYKIN